MAQKQRRAPGGLVGVAGVWLTWVSIGTGASTEVMAQTIPSLPEYTLVETGKKVYGRASHDFRAIGCIDYWFVGHDLKDSPFACQKGSPGKYTLQKYKLPTQAVDGGNMDRHECGFMHLDGDGKIDMVCTLGADKGKGEGVNEVFRNTSSKKAVSMERITKPTGIEDPYGRGRTVQPFKWADGTQGVWTTVHGAYRSDGKPNINRLFRYGAPGSFYFTEVPEPLVNVTTYNNCSRSGDLNGDGLDDLLLCRTVGEGGTAAADSVVLYQQADMSWRTAVLPMATKTWITAEIHDLNGDGRQDLVVSVEEAGQYRIELYLQAANGSLPSTASWSSPLPVKGNSIAIGDLNGDGRPDLYVTQADSKACQDQVKAKGSMTDTWPDRVFYASPYADQWAQQVLVNEPQAYGCSWLATAAEPGVVHLGRGLEGEVGDSYVVLFGHKASSSVQGAVALPTEAQRKAQWRDAILGQIRGR